MAQTCKTTGFKPRQKRKSGDLPPQTREYSKRPRHAPRSYADPDHSDDSAFYETDKEGEGVKTRKARRPVQGRPLPKRKIFPFLSLPRELRDLIYDYALGCPCVEVTTITPYDSNNRRFPSDCSAGSPNSYTVPCNVVRLEGTTVGVRRTTQRTKYTANRVFRPDQIRGKSNAAAAAAVAAAVAAAAAKDANDNNADDEDAGAGAADKQPLLLERWWAVQPGQVSTALLRTCRQVRAEATPVLYNERTRFEFVDSASLLTFVGQLSRGTRGLLRDVRLMRWEGRRSLCQANDKAVFEMLAESVTRLSAFRVEPGRYSDRVERREAAKICRLGWRWLQAMATEKDDGIDGVLAVLSVGLQAWGNGWKVGEESWTVYANEFKKLMKAASE